MICSLDTETTGIDFKHGARPYFVTSCSDDGTIRYWEWDVDPKTREPRMGEDGKEVAALVRDPVNRLVLQNSKFDVRALVNAGIVSPDEWPWDRTDDTLVAGHLLASNQPHDLTAMAIHYLGVDIQPYDDRLKDACLEARRLARSRYPEWRIAKAGLPEMPSAKETVWKYDGWMPRAIAMEEGYADDHPWWTVLSEYANADSSTTVALWKVMREEVRRRGLEAIYAVSLQRMRLAYNMEEHGVTYSEDRRKKVYAECERGSREAGADCVRIAGEVGVELEIPKAGSNKSLDRAVEQLLIEDTATTIYRTPTGRPSTNKAAVEAYVAELPEGSTSQRFFTRLRDKRKRDTAVSYLEGYRRFGVPWFPNGNIWYVLYPSLNPTGTDTLRWSSNNPNEQNISKQENFNLRTVFGPASGREWWSLDARNIELRLPAYESGERELIDLFERPDEPPYYGSTHLLNFSTVYPDLWEEEERAVGREKVGPHVKKKYASTWYQWCKNGGFAVQYGAVDRDDGGGTADRAFHCRGAHAKLKARFSKLEVLNQYWIRYAEERGYVETMPDRAVDPKRGYPLLCTRTEWGRVLPTVPLNYHVQGSAMWWMMKAMIRCDAYLRELNEAVRRGEAWGPGGYHIVLQVHDELVFDFPQGRGPEPWKTNLPKIRKVRRLMEEGGDDLGVPTPVSLEYHPDNWSEGRSL